jgi:hypothetical protein
MHRSMVSNLMYQVFFLMTFIHQRISLHQQSLFLINYVWLKRHFSSNGKRIYVAEESTAVYFLKKFPSYASVNRTIVSVRELKQSTTYCHPAD